MISPGQITGLDYPFQDGIPTAQPVSSNGIGLFPVDRVPIIPSPNGPYLPNDFFTIQPVDRIPVPEPLQFFEPSTGDVPVTVPDNPKQLPPADQPSTPGRITIPDVPSDIGGFIPDMPGLPVTVSPAPDEGQSPTNGTDGQEPPKTTTDKLIDLVAAMFGGGGSGGGGIAALPTGIVPAPASTSSNKGILVIFLLIGVGLLAFWYFKKRKGK